MTKKQIVILGGGFAGIAALRELRHVDAEVTIVDCKTSQIFQPLLFQAATCNICAGDLESPIRGQLHGCTHFHFVQDRVTNVDVPNKQVHLASGKVLPYDYLLMALGSVTNFYGNDRLSEHALTMKDQKEAIDIRSKLLAALERRANATPEEQAKPMNLVIVGGGPTGVELMGALVEFLKDRWDKYYPSLKGNPPQCYLLEAGPCILGPLPPHQQQKAQRWLERMGVKVMTHAKIEDYDGHTVTIAGEDPIETEFLVWCAGVCCDKVVGTLGLEQDRGGRISVDPDLRATGQDSIWVAGDTMHYVPQGAERPLPTTAAVATQAGRAAGKNIAAAVAGQPGQPFHYKDKGFIAVVSKGHAVGRIGPIAMSGCLCWLAWATLHIFLPYAGHIRWSIFWKFLWNVVRGASPYRNG